MLTTILYGGTRSACEKYSRTKFRHFSKESHIVSYRIGSCIVFVSISHTSHIYFKMRKSGREEELFSPFFLSGSSDHDQGEKILMRNVRISEFSPFFSRSLLSYHPSLTRPSLSRCILNSSSVSTLHARQI